MALIAKNVDTGVVIAERVMVAATRQTRRTGLLKHDSLPAGEGLWIVPCRGVHTFGMKFSIDVIALDESGRVIDLVANLKPRRIRLPRRGTAGVLELPAGWLAKTGTLLGHRLEFSVAPTLARRSPSEGGAPRRAEEAA
jgi:uncharacterized membrane protein (UPF0127 family)